MNWVAYAIISTFLYGLWGVLSNIALNHIGFASLLVYNFLVFSVGGLIAFSLNDFKLDA